MKIKKPTNAQLATVGSIAGVLGLAMGGVALADGMARSDTSDGPRPYYDVVAEGTRQAVPPPPPAPRSPPPPVISADDGPRPPRVSHPPRGAEHAALDARHHDHRGPPHTRGDSRPRAQTWVLCDIERDGDMDCDEDDWRGVDSFRPERDSRGSQWVRCEVERDGDIDCDEDDRRTWAPPA